MTEPRGYPRPDPDEPRGRIVGWIVLADGERLGVTVHCVDRYWERAALGCTGFRHALIHLQRIAAAVGAEAPRPEWAGPGVATERWIALAPDVGLFAGRQAAVTCLARGMDPHPATPAKAPPAAALLGRILRATPTAQPSTSRLHARTVGSSSRRWA